MITPINLGDSSWGSYSLKLRISTNDLQISPLELMKFARWFHSGPPAHPHGPTHRTDGSAACLGTHSEWPPQKPLMPLGSLEGPSILPCLPSWPLFENSEFNQSKRGDCQVHHLIFRSRNCKSSPSTSGIRWKKPFDHSQLLRLARTPFGSARSSSSVPVLQREHEKSCDFRLGFCTVCNLL
jgi:hypothetical protein